jgi:hypothetical protein
VSARKPKATFGEVHAALAADARGKLSETMTKTPSMYWRIAQLHQCIDGHASLSAYWESGQFVDLIPALIADRSVALHAPKPGQGVPKLIKLLTEGLLGRVKGDYSSEKWPLLLERGEEARQLAIVEDKAREERRANFVREDLTDPAYTDPESERRSFVLNRTWRLLQYIGNHEAAKFHSEYRNFVPEAQPASRIEEIRGQIEAAISILDYAGLELADAALDALEALK